MITAASREIAQALHAAVQRADVPQTVHIDATYRCGLACKHCYLDNRTTWPEMTGAELRALVDQLADFGVWKLLWSGGELFERADMDELLAYAAQRGFAQTLKSHAGLIDAARARHLAALRIAQVHVSVYSLRPAVHDAFTQRAGSLAATCAGIAELRAAGVAVRVSCVVQSNTIDEMEALFACFSAQGCNVVFGNDIFRNHLGNEDLDVLAMPPADFQRAEEKRLRLTPAPPRPPVSERQGQGACSAGRSRAYVTPDGAVWPCSQFPMALGNLREQSFAAIWRGSVERQQIVAWKNRDRTSCTSCGGSGHCAYCPGEAFKQTGDFRKAPVQFHEQTRYRMAAYEAATGQPLGPEVWQGVPSGGPRLPRPERFVFPIYRPKKGQGARVQPPAK